MEVDGERIRCHVAKHPEVDQQGFAEEPAEKGRAGMDEVQKCVGRNGSGEENENEEEEGSRDKNMEQDIAQGVIQRILGGSRNRSWKEGESQPGFPDDLEDVPNLEVPDE